MNCDQIRIEIPELLAGRLDGSARRRVMDHLDACSACGAEAARLEAVWRGLEPVGEVEPGPAMRARFLERLRAYQEGLLDAPRPGARGLRLPAWQFACAILLVAAGAFAGRFLPRSAPANPEIAELRAQVENLRQLVAVSLLQDPSAGSRLRGVTYSYQVSRRDEQVEQALLYAASHDSNVNVRLSAVDALAKFADAPAVRRALADALALQDSPLVEMAVIDLLAQSRAREAVPALLRLSHNPEADETVRRRAASALEKLGGMQ